MQERICEQEYFVTSRRPEGTYSAVMNLFFEPSAGVTMLFLKTMKELGLKPRQYLAAHFRDRLRILMQYLCYTLYSIHTFHTEKQKCQKSINATYSTTP